VPDRQITMHDFFGMTRRGQKRSVNQDQFLVARLTRTASQLYTSLTHVAHPFWEHASEAYLLVVADGLGSGGRPASSIAVEVLSEEIAAAARGYWGLDVESEHELLERLEGAVRAAHERVVARNVGSDLLEVSKAATTITMTMLLWPRAYVLHVGDSRGYYLHGGQLRRFTQDQSVEEALLDSGAIPESEAGQSGLSKVLARAVGGEDATPRVGLVDLDEGDVLMLCTDGLTRCVEDDTLRAVLEQDISAQQMCEQLLAAALDADGEDDITIIIGRMGFIT